MKRPLLKKGDRCPEVLILQDYLLQLGFMKAREISGVMDERTNRALRRFQLKSEMPITGVTDKSTWAEIDKAIKEMVK